MNESSPIQLPPVRPQAADEITFVGTATTIIVVDGFSTLPDPNFLHRGDRTYMARRLSAKCLTDGPWCE